MIIINKQMDQFSHIEFEELLKDEENMKCFDCGIT